MSFGNVGFESSYNPEDQKQRLELQAREQMGAVLSNLGELQEIGKQRVANALIGGIDDTTKIQALISNAVNAKVKSLQGGLGALQQTAEQRLSGAVGALQEMCNCLAQQTGEQPQQPGQPGEPGEPQPEEPQPQEPEPEEPEPEEPEPEIPPDIGGDPDAPKCEDIARECPEGFHLIEDVDNACGWSCEPDDPLVVSCPDGFTPEYDGAGNLIACHPNHQPEIPPEEPELPEPEPEEPEEPEPEPEEPEEPGEQLEFTRLPAIPGGSRPSGLGAVCTAGKWTATAAAVGPALSTEKKSFFQEFGRQLIISAGLVRPAPQDEKWWAQNASFMTAAESTVESWTDKFLETLGLPANCTGLWATRVAIGAADRWVSSDIRYLMTPMIYETNQCNPVLYPTADQAAKAYLSGEITEEVLQSWAEINGNCWLPFERIVVANKAKLAPQDIVTAHMRGIVDETQYKRKIREHGFIDEDATDIIKRLFEQVPPVQDLLRFMVRDVADAGLVEKFGLDALFDQKFTGKVEEWAKWQGLTKEFAQNHWRAHWSIPSPTQLFTMFHRLRHLADGDANRVTLDDVETALTQDDILPFWIPKLLATSFNPLTRVDTRRMYEIGAIDDEAVLQSYYDQGYNDENAAKLLEFTKRLRKRSIYNHPAVLLWQRESITREDAARRMEIDGIPQDVIADVLGDLARKNRNHRAVAKYRQQKITRQAASRILENAGYLEAEFGPWLDEVELEFHSHPIMPQWEQGLISKDQFVSILREWGWSDPTISRLLVEGRVRIDAANRRLCISSVRRRAIMGEFEPGKLQDALLSVGLDTEQANDIRGQIECVRSAIGRTIPTAKLCQFADLGAITDQQFFERLLRLNHSREDAGAIVSDCRAKIGIKRQREAERLIKQNAAEIAKRERLAKQTAREVERMAAKAEKMRTAAQDARERRRAALGRAASKLAQKTDDQIAFVFQEAEAAYRTIRDSLNLSPDDSVQSVVLASESYGGESLAGFREFALAVARQFAESQEIILSSNGNGSFA